MRESLRKSGIDIIGDMPWGTHFCQFYQTKEDLVEILVPYFKAGLENNELCVWITSRPLEVEEAKEAMKRAVPNIDIYLEKGQIEIIPYTHGYIKEGIFDPDRVVNSWVEKIDQVLTSGYDGLRASGDNRWLEKEGWSDFVNYEKKVDAFIDKNLVIALCPYYLDMCSTAEIIDVISNHQFALIKREGKWERIENSGRKRAEKEAIQAAKNWKYTFDAVPDLVAIIDNECRIVRANRAMAARLGVTPEECVGLTCHRVIHGTDSPPSFCPHRQLLEDGAEHTTEVCEDHLGGCFVVSTTPLNDSEGKLIGSVYVARDVNELKQEEHRIRRYNRILEGINRIFSNVVQAKTEEELGNSCLSVALEVTGSEFGFINEMGTDGLLHDLAKSELGWEQCLMYDKTGHRRPLSDFIVHGLYGSVIINEKSFFTNDPQSHPDSIGLPEGHPPLTSFLGVPLVQDGKTIGLIAVANHEGGYSCEQQEDLEAIAPAVTQALQRKRSEEALRLSNIYNRSLLEASLDPLVTIGHDGKITDVNGATEQVTGYSRNELIGTDFSDYFTEPQEARKGYQQVFTEGTVRDYPLEILHKDGHITPVLYHASVYKDENGEVIGVFAAARDITERKRAEEALRESEERLRLLGDNLPNSAVYQYVHEPDGSVRFLYFSTGIERLNGVSVQDVLRDPNTLYRQVLPDYLEKVFEAEARSVRELSDYDIELPMRLPDGKMRWMRLHSRPRRLPDGRIIWDGVQIDITKHKQAEEALRKSEERYRMLFTNMTEGFALTEVIYDKYGRPCDYRYLEINPAYELNNGVKKEELLGKTLLEVFPNTTATTIEKFGEVALSGQSTNFEIFSQLVNKYIDIYAFSPEKGKLAAIIRDVTSRKETEARLKETLDNLENLVKERTAELEKAYISLKESEKGLAEAQKMAHIGNWDWNLITGKTYWSAEMYRIYGRSPQESGATYDELLNYIHPDDREYVDNAIKKALNEKPSGIDYRIITASGEERKVHAESEVTFDPNNRPIRAKGIIQDITERKEAEEALANIEIARKKEIHHRIKNNLQVISSLLDLQADKFDNPRVIEAFRESQNRVISMALIHEELYKGKGTDTLDFSTYIRGLAENLFQTYSLKSKNIHLSMDLEENVFLNMDTGVPLGIIVNELVSNSLKHAFPGRDRGEIQIKLHREKNEKHKKECVKATSFILIVSDNGIGIPENLNIEEVDSLGIQLITTLVDQLEGELELKRNNGTEFTIKFTVTEKK